MRPVDYAICLVSATVMIVGGYQFHFVPVRIPDRWRVYDVNGSLSLRMLAWLFTRWLLS